MGHYIDIDLEDGSVRAFVERPASGSGPAVVVLHEVFGVNDDMRTSSRELAEQGFVAIVPELFWRQERGVDMSHWTPAEVDKAVALYEAYDRDRGARDIAGIMQFAATLSGVTGKVGLVGFCLGGLMTYLVSARHGADAAVAYYPGTAEHYVSEAKAIRTPLMIHLGEEDEYISRDAQRAIKEAVAGNPAVTVYSYAGCAHAFARHTGTRYDAPAAALANGRSWQFLKDNLIGRD